MRETQRRASSMRSWSGRRMIPTSVAVVSGLLALASVSPALAQQPKPAAAPTAKPAAAAPAASAKPADKPAAAPGKPAAAPADKAAADKTAAAKPAKPLTEKQKK